jgi:Nucleoside 2-deoxyribosyltransferase
MRIYLGGAMFTAAQVAYNLQLANRLRSDRFDVYCPNENATINDKTRTDITGERIYSTDIAELLSSNVFLCQVSEDSGTMWESGFMDCLARHVDSKRYLGCIGLAEDIRLSTPPDPARPGVDNQTMYVNQFVVGALKLSLGIYTDVDNLAARLRRLREETHA